MPSRINATLKGARALVSRVKNIRDHFPDHVGLALNQESEVESTEVKRRTPVDKGTLRSTVHVEGPFREGRRIWTFIVAGGPSAPYAIYVHENLEALHKVGQAKFLESVIMESRPFMAARVARRIQLNEMNS